VLERTGVAENQKREIFSDPPTLSGLLLVEETLQAALTRVAALSLVSLPACDGAGISLREGTKVTMAGATDENIEAVDSEQYRIDEGPCLEAIRCGTSVIVESMADDERWPKFGAYAAKMGILSSLSLPLRVNGRTLGALNLYSRKVAGFSLSDEKRATSFATQASVAVANAQTFDRVRVLARHLEEGLKSSRVIGLAMGILVERESCTEDEAFDMLRLISQNANIKLRDVAQQLLDRARGQKERAGA
jgi:GAF domain-containing protein